MLYSALYPSYDCLILTKIFCHCLVQFRQYSAIVRVIVWVKIHYEVGRDWGEAEVRTQHFV